MAAVSFLILAGMAFAGVLILRRRELERRGKPGQAGLSEFRTELPLDDCLDRLETPGPGDEFIYTAQRQTDGGFLFHLTLHTPTSQPLDTLFNLRFESGRQTVVTLIFLSEAFGYNEPVFGAALMDRFMAAKFEAHRTK